MVVLPDWMIRFESLHIFFLLICFEFIDHFFVRTTATSTKKQLNQHRDFSAEFHWKL